MTAVLMGSRMVRFFSTMALSFCICPRNSAAFFTTSMAFCVFSAFVSVVLSFFMGPATLSRNLLFPLTYMSTMEEMDL